MNQKVAVTHNGGRGGSFRLPKKGDRVLFLPNRGPTIQKKKAWEGWDGGKGTACSAFYNVAGSQKDCLFPLSRLVILTGLVPKRGGAARKESIRTKRVQIKKWPTRGGCEKTSVIFIVRKSLRR